MTSYRLINRVFGPLPVLAAVAVFVGNYHELTRPGGRPRPEDARGAVVDQAGPLASPLPGESRGLVTGKLPGGSARRTAPRRSGAGNNFRHTY